MADFFLSDVHIRLDKPERGQRLARFLREVQSTDRLWIVGDLCDFWFATRQLRPTPDDCPGLTALRAFRHSGGALSILLGNHDAWLGDAYERWFDLTITTEPHAVVSHGFRLKLSHGHRVKGKKWWKAFMESRAFSTAFTLTPKFAARGFDALLNANNERTRHQSEVRMIAEYRAMADQFRDCDIAVFGHVHRAHDDTSRSPRLIVLGDWTERVHFLRLDETGAIHHASDPPDAAEIAQSPAGAPGTPPVSA